MPIYNNGYRSSCRKIYCGIRQGCPLAPLLFILALDSVYRVIQERGEIRGAPLTSGGKTTDVKISGYADDTAVYLRDQPAVLSVVTILDDFAAVSGLQTNRAKSIIIAIVSRIINAFEHMWSQSTVFNRVLSISWCTFEPTWFDTCQLVKLHTINMESTCTSAREDSYGGTTS